MLDGREGVLFTTAYFHRPSQLREEVATAGFVGPDVISIEGPGFLVPNFDDRWLDPARRDALLQSARLIETDPDMLAAASHLMVVARAPKV